MKKLFLFMAVLLAVQTSFAQVDSLTPQGRVQTSFNKIIGKKILALPNNGITNVLRDLTKMAATRTPFLSMADVRKGFADTAKVIQIYNGNLLYPFIYDPTNTTSADDSATVIRHGNRRYVIALNVYTPEMFGAVGNGIADDWKPIQKAINKGGVLHFAENKTYYATRGFTSTKQYVNIFGNGATIKFDSQLATATNYGFFFTGLTRVVMQDLTIDNVNYLGQTTWQTRMIPSISVQSTGQFDAVNITIIKNPWCPIFTNNTKVVNISDSQILRYYRDGMEIEYADVVNLSENYVLGVGDEIPSALNPNDDNGSNMLQGGTGIGIQITHSDIVNVWHNKILNTLDTGLKVETSEQITIDGNNIQGQGKDGISLMSRSGSTSNNGASEELRNVVIVNNYVWNSVKRRSDGSALILLHHVAGAVVSNNRCGDTTKVGGTSNGIRFTDIDGAIGHNANGIVTNNIIGKISNGSHSILISGELTENYNMLVQGNQTKTKVFISKFNGVVKVLDNYFSSTAGGSTLDFDRVPNLEASGNVIYSGGSGIRAAQIDTYPYRAVFRNNRIQSVVEGIYTTALINGTSTTLPATYPRIIEAYDNDLQAIISGTASLNYTGKAFNLGNSSEIKIKRNRIRGYGEGVYIAGFLVLTQTDGSVIDISENDIRDIGECGVNITNAGSVLKTCDLLNIANNQFANVNIKNATKSAIRISHGDAITFNNLKIVDNNNSVVKNLFAAPLITFGGSNSTLKIVNFLFLNNFQDNPTGAFDQTNFVSYVTNYRGTPFVSTINPPSIAAGASYTTTVPIPVTLASGRTIVSVKPNGDLGAGITLTGRVTADNTVTLEYKNTSAAAIDLPSTTMVYAVN